MSVKIFILQVFWFFVFVSLLYSCKSLPACYHKGEVLKWGTIISNGKSVTYEMVPGREIKLTVIEKSEEKSEQHFKSFSNEFYCRQLTKLKLMFLSNAVINQPGDSLCYIELDNDNTGLELSAVWNPVFKLEVTDKYRQMYDSLMSQIKFTDLYKKD